MPHMPLPHNHGQHIELNMDSLPDTEAFKIVSNLFKQLCDESRIRIFWLLCHCEECVINLAAMMNMSSPAVSHHLRQLKDSGVVVSRREGKEVYYKAADTGQVKLLHSMIETLMEISCPSEQEK